MREAYLTWIDDEGREHRFPLGDAADSVTVGRRREADVSLSHDREVSRLHAELQLRAGEWAIADDGLSQNGTFVNELPVLGRRRLADGDEIRVGRTRLTFVAGPDDAEDVTLLPAHLAPGMSFSDQQQRVLRALCRPLFADGEGVAAAPDEQIADETGIPLSVVRGELDQLERRFGLDDLPPRARRAEVALMAVRAGLVGHEDFEGSAGQ